jgi:hypothetical protein
MTAIVILNIVFAVFVVGGIVALLGRAIILDNPRERLLRGRTAPAKPAAPRHARSARGALDFGS